MGVPLNRLTSREADWKNGILPKDAKEVLWPYCNPSYLRLASRVLNPRQEQLSDTKKTKLLPCQMSGVTFELSWLILSTGLF